MSPPWGADCRRTVHGRGVTTRRSHQGTQTRARPRTGFCFHYSFLNALGGVDGAVCRPVHLLGKPGSVEARPERFGPETGRRRQGRAGAAGHARRQAWLGKWETTHDKKKKKKRDTPNTNSIQNRAQKNLPAENNRDAAAGGPQGWELREGRVGQRRRGAGGREGLAGSQRQSQGWGSAGGTGYRRLAVARWGRWGRWGRACLAKRPRWQALYGDGRESGSHTGSHRQIHRQSSGQTVK